VEELFRRLSKNFRPAQSEFKFLFNGNKLIYHWNQAREIAYRNNYNILIKIYEPCFQMLTITNVDDLSCAESIQFNLSLFTFILFYL
jgi:hypothetical protein